MKTIKLAMGHGLAGAAAMLLGSVAWSGAVFAQAASTTNAAPAAVTTNAASTAAATANPNAAAAATFANNRGGRGPGGGGRGPGGGGGSGGGGSGGGRGPSDGGVRGGDPGAGGSLQGLGDNENQYFAGSKDVFMEVDAVPNGLGPRFNLDSCAGCHAHPTVGGSAPPVNPQVAIATAAGAKNVVPSFITADGPVRVARFVRNPDGSPDGSVHALFTITGRSDAPGCNIKQPNFAAAVASNNVIFRIPTPLYGLGLVENVTDTALQSSLAANAQQKRSLGINGHFNTNTNDQTITRFGWKAQNKSLLLFSGEAYNVEMGITNDLFQTEREGDPNCQFNATPESVVPLTAADLASPAASFQSDIELFSAFMRGTAPPVPAGAAAPAAQAAAGATGQTAAAATPQTTAAAGSTTAPAGQTTGAASTTPAAASTTSTMLASAAADASSVMTAAAGSTATAAAQPAASTAGASVTRGAQVFTNIGCQACHTQSLTTTKSQMTGQSNVTIQPFSDFAVHDMGSGLADGVTQGNANGNEFRTAPLWGVGQRIFFLHDGRTKDLTVAIQQHSSRGSEANTVINNFNLLSATDQQSLINYLRTL
jgi:CxxC motif-containing protein (DUF1111 family)